MHLFITIKLEDLRCKKEKWILENVAVCRCLTRQNKVNFSDF